MYELGTYRALEGAKQVKPFERTSLPQEPHRRLEEPPREEQMGEAISSGGEEYRLRMMGQQLENLEKKTHLYERGPCELFCSMANHRVSHFVAKNHLLVNGVIVYQSAQPNIFRCWKIFKDNGKYL